MKHSIFATVAVAAAATMISLSPALADRGDRDDYRHDRSQHTERSYGHDHHRGDRSDYRPRHYGYGYGYGYGHHRHHHRPYWMKRFYGWNYGHRPHRPWW